MNPQQPFFGVPAQEPESTPQQFGQPAPELQAQPLTQPLPQQQAQFQQSVPLPQQSFNQQSPFPGQPQQAFAQQQPVTPVGSAPRPPKQHRPLLWLIVAIVSIVLALGAIGAFVWAFMNYTDQKDNVDTKVSSAVATAEKTQADKLEAEFLERDKAPNRNFTSPEDYGTVSFDYPKTWSLFVDKDGSSGSSYQAYFNPIAVPSISAAERFSLRLTIESRDYDTVVKSYDSLVKKGDLKVNIVKIDGQDAARFDGNFTKDIRGSAVVFKIRDKTATFRTDADTFKADFDALISTITFIK